MARQSPNAIGSFLDAYIYCGCDGVGDCGGDVQSDGDVFSCLLFTKKGTLLSTVTKHYYDRYRPSVSTDVSTVW